MTCPDCVAAAAGPHFIFRASCLGCAARAIARSPDFHRCRTARMQDRAYRALLAAAGVTHEQVTAASAQDRERTAP